MADTKKKKKVVKKDYDYWSDFVGKLNIDEILNLDAALRDCFSEIESRRQDC